MLRTRLDEAIKKDRDILLSGLESCHCKLKIIRDEDLAFTKILEAAKKNRSLKALLDYFNFRGEHEQNNKTIKVNTAVELTPNIKVERKSNDLPDSTNMAVAVDTGSIFTGDEALVKEEPGLMPPPTVRPKRGRKKNADKASISSSDSSSSTRSSARTTRLNSVRESEVVCTEPPLECVSLSDEECPKSIPEIKKAAAPVKRSTRLELSANNIETDEMRSAPATRNTRSKRIQNKAADVNETITIKQSANETKQIIHKDTSTTIATSNYEQKKLISDCRESDSKTDDRNKRLRSPSKEQKKGHIKRQKSDNSDSQFQSNISGQTVYEDASADLMQECYKFKMDAVVMLESCTIPSKSINVNDINVDVDKPASTYLENGKSNTKSQANETVIISSKTVIPSEAIIIEKNAQAENLINSDDIMTDDETPPPSTTKAKVFGPASSTQSKTLKKNGGFKSVENGSPVKKLVQAFENMGKGGGDRITPKASKNTTPTMQNRLRIVNGSASKVNTCIPVSVSKTGGTGVNRNVSNAASASAIKRSQQEFYERELQRRQKEEEARKKREQNLKAQTEERRKRAEAQELKILQVQQKKELINLQKLQHLDEIQRQKDEKARHVLQEKLDKQKEDLEKKRLRYKKGGQDGSALTEPIYMTHPTPLLSTNDCYDSDEENANVKRVRNKPVWTMQDQLYPRLRSMSDLLDNVSVRNGLFAPKPCTPNLMDIFQDIDPVKLSRTSSAVWRKPPRATLVHLPSFTEEAEPAN